MLTLDLSGQTALVTGASRGIGRAIALGLARAGADVVGVSASLDPDGDTAQEVRATGRAFAGYAADLGDRTALHAFCDRVEGDGHRVDILVNNAGLIRRAGIADHPEADWDAVIAVNQTAPFLLTQRFGRGMLARGHGKVVFIASVLSFQGGILVPGYAASKAAVASLARSFANEWAAQGVNVNALAPGYVATDNTAALQADPERTAALMARVPAGRWGTPEEIAEPVVFLCSDAARFVHGATLAVDGGWLGR